MAQGFELYQQAVALWNAGRRQEALRLFGMVTGGAYPDRLPKEKFVPLPPERPPRAIQPRTSAMERFLDDKDTEFSPPSVEDATSAFWERFADFSQGRAKAIEGGRVVNTAQSTDPTGLSQRYFQAFEGLFPPQQIALTQDERLARVVTRATSNQLLQRGRHLQQQQQGMVSLGRRIKDIEDQLAIRPGTLTERLRREQLKKEFYALIGQRQLMSQDLRGLEGDVQRVERVWRHIHGYDIEGSPLDPYNEMQTGLPSIPRRGGPFQRVEDLRDRLGLTGRGRLGGLSPDAIALLQEQLAAGEKDVQAAALRTSLTVNRNFLRLMESGVLPSAGGIGNIFIAPSGQLRGTPVRARLLPLEIPGGEGAETEFLSRPHLELQPVNLASEAVLGQMQVRMKHQGPVVQRQLRAFMGVSSESRQQFGDVQEQAYRAEAQRRLNTRITSQIRSSFEARGVSFNPEDRRLISELGVSDIAQMNLRLLFGRQSEEFKTRPGQMTRGDPRHWVKVGKDVPVSAPEVAEELFLGSSLYRDRPSKILAQRSDWGFQYQKEMRRIVTGRDASLSSFDKQVKEALLTALPELEGIAPNEFYKKIKEAANRIPSMPRNTGDYNRMLGIEHGDVRAAATAAKDLMLPIHGFQDFSHPDFSAAQAFQEAENRLDVNGEIQALVKTMQRKFAAGENIDKENKRLKYLIRTEKRRRHVARQQEGWATRLQAALERRDIATSPAQVEVLDRRIRLLRSRLAGFGKPTVAEARVKSSLEALRRYIGLPLEAMEPVEAALLRGLTDEAIDNPFYGASALDVLQKLNVVAEEGTPLSLTLGDKVFEAVLGARPIYDKGDAERASRLALKFNILNDPTSAAMKLYDQTADEAVNLVSQGWGGPVVNFEFQSLHSLSAPDPAEMSYVQLQARMRELNIRGRSTITHKEDMVDAIRRSMMDAGTGPENDTYIARLLNEARDTIKDGKFQLFGRTHRGTPSTARIAAIVQEEGRRMSADPGVREALGMIGSLVPTAGTPGPVREALVNFPVGLERYEEAAAAGKINKVALTRNEQNRQTIEQVTRHYKTVMNKNRNISLTDRSLSPTSESNFYRPVWDAIDERLAKSGYSVQEIIDISTQMGKTVDLSRAALPDYSKEELDELKDKFARYGDEDAQILLRDFRDIIPSPLRAGNRVAIPGLPEEQNVEMGELFRLSYMQHTADSELKTELAKSGISLNAFDWDDIMAQSMRRHIENVLKLSKEEAVWKRMPEPLRKKLAQHLEPPTDITPRHLKEAYAQRVVAPTIREAAGEAPSIAPEAVKAAEAVGEAAAGPRFTRFNINQLREALGSSHYLKYGAYAVGAVAAVGVIHAGLKAHKQDRTEEDMTGPPIMPGGNPYDTSRGSGTNNYVRSGLPGYAPYGNNGMAYQVNARGNYDPAEIQAQIEAITGGSAYGTISNSPSDVDQRQKQLNSLLNNY